jgi:hypothetical protein
MWNGLFRDHEIYVRTGGEVRFLHLGARLQRRVAMLVLAVLGAWLMGTAALLGWQAWTSWKTRGMADRAAAIALAEARVTAERAAWRRSRGRSIPGRTSWRRWWAPSSERPQPMARPVRQFLRLPPPRLLSPRLLP